MPEPPPDLRRLAAVGIAVLAFAGCGGGGGDDDNGSAGGTVASSPGAGVFESAGCGNCHTFEAADATGQVGPNLDEADVTADEAEQQVRQGGNGMPAFDDELSDQEIRDVAEFVAGG